MFKTKKMAEKPSANDVMRESKNYIKKGRKVKNKKVKTKEKIIFHFF